MLYNRNILLLFHLSYQIYFYWLGIKFNLWIRNIEHCIRAYYITIQVEKYMKRK